MNWLEQAPLPIVGVTLFAVLVLAHEAAFRVGRRLGRRADGGESRGYLVSSALALLGLLMAFTFSAAQDRYRLRQELIVAEANAIGTTYLRIQLVDPPWRDALSRDLLAYAETRPGFVAAQTQTKVAQNAAQAAVLQERIWRDLSPAVRATPLPGVDLALIQTINETFDLAAARRAARENRVPPPVVRVLLISSVVVAAIVGYSEACDQRHTGVMLGVLLLLTLAFCLILDLDRPVGGRARINLAPMDRAVADLRAGEAARAAAPLGTGEGQPGNVPARP